MNSGTSKAIKNLHTGPSREVTFPLIPLLEPLHSPVPEEREAGAAKLQQAQGVAPDLSDMSEGAHLSIARQHLGTVAKGLIDDRESSVKRAAVIDALAAVDRALHAGQQRVLCARRGTVSATLKASEATSKGGEASIPAAAVKKCGRKGRGSTAPVGEGEEQQHAQQLHQQEEQLQQQPAPAPPPPQQKQQQHQQH